MWVLSWAGRETDSLLLCIFHWEWTQGTESAQIKHMPFLFCPRWAVSMPCSDGSDQSQIVPWPCSSALLNHSFSGALQQRWHWFDFPTPYPGKWKKTLFVCLFVFPTQISCIRSQSNLLSGNETLIIRVLARDFRVFFPPPVYGSFQWGANIVNQKESAQAARRIMELFFCFSMRVWAFVKRRWWGQRRETFTVGRQESAVALCWDMAVPVPPCLLCSALVGTPGTHTVTLHVPGKWVKLAQPFTMLPVSHVRQNIRKL